MINTLNHLINDNNVVNIYLNGSRLYGVNNENSDYDYEVVVKKKTIDQLRVENSDFNFYSIDEWQQMGANSDVIFLESIFADNDFKIKETLFVDYSLNNIRHTFSKLSSNSWVKCKKKLTVEKDYNPYIGKKSLWHSLRIIMFGIQIAKHNKIIDYTVANKYYDDIVNNDNNDWEYYKKIYQPIYNQLKTEFRKVTEK